MGRRKPNIEGGTFLVSSALGVHERVVIAFTGTPEKFTTLEEIVRPEGVFIPGIIELLQFEGAGKAKEPVTADCVNLIIGKQGGQKQLFLESLYQDAAMRTKLNGDRLLFASNDVDTKVVGVPLTKSRLQKEDKLSIEQYQKLIVASLRYLAMMHDGYSPGFTWSELQADWSRIDDCLNDPWRQHVFLPIDYQVVDAFELNRLTVCKSEKPRLEIVSPKVVVINQAYASIQLDFSKNNRLVRKVVDDYLRKNWTKPEFTPDRYPLGIKQADLLREFLDHNQHVTFSDHETERVIYLRDSGTTHGRKEVDETLQRIETMLNGYGKSSLNLADQYLTNERRLNSIFVINRKPGQSDVVSNRRVAI